MGIGHTSEPESSFYKREEGSPGEGTVSPGTGPRKSSGFEEKLPDVLVLLILRVDPGGGVKSEPCLGTFYNSNFFYKKRLVCLPGASTHMTSSHVPSGLTLLKMPLRREANWAPMCLPLPLLLPAASRPRASSFGHPSSTVRVGSPRCVLPSPLLLPFLLMSWGGLSPKGEGSWLPAGKNSSASQMRD